MQRLKIQATARRGSQTEAVTEYLAQILRDEGATNVSAHGVAKKRGGGLQITADAIDAVAVMRAVRAKLDGDTNRYAADVLNDLTIGAFKDGSGGMLGFADEDYRFTREAS